MPTARSAFPAERLPRFSNLKAHIGNQRRRDRSASIVLLVVLKRRALPFRRAYRNKRGKTKRILV
jgi:hypothetical protein